MVDRDGATCSSGHLCCGVLFKALAVAKNASGKRSGVQARRPRQAPHLVPVDPAEGEVLCISKRWRYRRLLARATVWSGLNKGVLGAAVGLECSALVYLTQEM